MNKKTKVLLTMTFIALSACNKATNTEVPNGTKILEGITPKSEVINGYKSFVFGMTPNEVVKLPECIDNYHSSFRVSDDFAKLESDLNEAKKLLGYKKRDAEDRIAKNSDAAEVATETENLAKINDGSDPLAQNVAKLEQEYQKGTTERNKVDTFAKEYVDNWAATAYCTVDFMGQPTSLKPYFVNNKLAIVALDLGDFDPERYRTLQTKLAEKYGLTQDISEEQRSAFNNDQLNEVATLFADAQIGLFAANRKVIPQIPGLTVDENYKYATPVLTRKISLQYAVASYKSKMVELASKGKTKSDDL